MYSATHGIAKSFCLSVHPSVYVSVIVKCVDGDKTKQNVCLHSYNTWKIIHPSFLGAGVGRPFLPEILGQTDPVGLKTPNFVAP